MAFAFSHLFPSPEGRATQSDEALPLKIAEAIQARTVSNSHLRHSKNV
jgi:hypothetical protein